MTKQEQTVTKQAYEKAIYRIHDTDDPELKKHFKGIIDSYEKAHPDRNNIAKLVTTKPQTER